MSQVTMQEIAKKAGISRPNVSKILNDKPVMVSDAKREKVLQVAKELNYQPNFLAKSLKLGKTPCIGVMGSLTIPNFDSLYFAEILNGVESVFLENKSKYLINIFGAAHEGNAEKSLELIQKGLVDGLLIVSLSFHLERFEKNILPEVERCNIPTVVLHSLSRSFPYNNVGLNSYQAGYDVADHLASLGHKDIGIFLKLPLYPQRQEMFKGFKKALQDHGIEWNEDLIIPPKKILDGAYGFESVYNTIMNHRELPTALFCPSNIGTYGMLEALHDRGAKVPDDISVVGYIDEPRPVFKTPEITAINHPVREKGIAGINLLLDILEGKKSRDEVHQEILQPEFVVRKTTGRR